MQKLQMSFQQFMVTEGNWECKVDIEGTSENVNCKKIFNLLEYVTITKIYTSNMINCIWIDSTTEQIVSKMIDFGPMILLFGSNSESITIQYQYLGGKKEAILDYKLKASKFATTRKLQNPVQFRHDLEELWKGKVYPVQFRHDLEELWKGKVYNMMPLLEVSKKIKKPQDLPKSYLINEVEKNLLDKYIQAYDKPVIESFYWGKLYIHFNPEDPVEELDSYDIVLKTGVLKTGEVNSDIIFSVSLEDRLESVQPKKK